MTFVDSCALLSFRRIFTTFVKRKKISCISTVRFHMDRRDESRSTMELINVPPIVSIYRQALQTFDDRFKSDFSNNMNKLKSSMDSIKAEDLGYDKVFNDEVTWQPANKAPCTYIEVFQNSQINMSIFILKPGFKMPLHDHPQMYGFLKVISGSVNIRSFTEFPLKDAVNVVDFAVLAKHEAARLTHGVHKKRRFFAEVTTNKTCTPSASCCVLTPTISNYHEIEALDKPAAFFDILAPPYDTLIDGIGPRRCRYYYVANEISTNLVELQETQVPKCFFCDQAPYLGPILA